LYPIGYGADPTGEKDSSDAILQALGDAFRLRTERELLPGISDFGGEVIDLQGGSYKISKPIRFPSSGGGNILVSLSLSLSLSPFLFFYLNIHTRGRRKLKLETFAAFGRLSYHLEFSLSRTPTLSCAITFLFS
jgi:hypothetical protein